MMEEFKRGLKDGLPIGLGYFSVSIAFGMMAIVLKRPVAEAVLISLTNLTSAGQFAGLQLIAAHGGLAELFLTTLIINARYFLMSLSISQKLDPEVTLWQKLCIAFGITDEIFAAAIGQKGSLRFPYMMGVIAVAMLGWTCGTFAGAQASSILPAVVTSAFGIALYGMFIAIIVPQARDHRNVRLAVLLSVCLSCIVFYVPVFSFLSSGWSIIVITLIVSGVMASVCPVDQEERMEEDGGFSIDRDGSDNVCDPGQPVFDLSQEDHE